MKQSEESAYWDTPKEEAKLNGVDDSDLLLVIVHHFLGFFLVSLSEVFGEKGEKIIDYMVQLVPHWKVLLVNDSF